MQVFDEVTNTFKDYRKCARVVIAQLPEQIILGFVSKTAPVTQILFYTKEGWERRLALKANFEDSIVYSNKQGYYISKIGVPESVLESEIHIKGQGRFPYDFQKKYEACENFDLFEGKQFTADLEKSYRLAEHLKYSFGLEFETSQGYVPEDICFRDGLIPLRDGSISGIEYSTVVLSGNEGIGLLERQLKSLKTYTNFNKECALHVHLGGFPLNETTLFNLHRICVSVEKEISSICPRYTFDTSEYKANGKDYCCRLPSYRSFNQMYEHLVGRKFFGSLVQPHPKDIRREAKWRIPTR